jgi:hypothetical protein
MIGRNVGAHAHAEHVVGGKIQRHRPARDRIAGPAGELHVHPQRLAVLAGIGGEAERHALGGKR